MKNKKGFYSLLCDKEILYHSFLGVLAMAVIIAQGCILNFYIIAYYRGYTHQVATYFWFLGDLFIVCFIATSCITAYRYIHLRNKYSARNMYSEDLIEGKIHHSIYKYISFLSPKYCGTLPFSFISWFVYSTYLTIKLCIIFSSSIPEQMTRQDEEEEKQTEQILRAGSNLLKVTIGSSALIFIIMLQAHHNHDHDSTHSGYVAGVCHNTAIEVFDSVTLLSLLFVNESKYLSDWHLDNAIIALSSINLILPTFAIYMMSLSDFGRKLDKIVKIKFAYQLLQLTVINIPFLGLRMYLWVQYNFNLSLFVVKNLCYIFMLLHSLYPAAKTIIVQTFMKTRFRRKSRIQEDHEMISVHGEQT
ncbi:uncharacterized protein [Lepeophtheirus salmonis]|uniref:uncharacterized protein isoform X2 n=1 Tax=Lepeophtheirus salmonis TaxID=72036 RepID=UPI003AF3A689